MAEQSQRRTSTTFTFARSFHLERGGDVYPPGTYTVDTLEELLQGVSFPAYRRIATTIQRVLDPSQPRQPAVVIADPRQLDLAVLQDRAKSSQARPAGKVSSARQVS